MNKKFLYPEFQRPRVSYREVGNCQVEEKEEGKMILEKGFSAGKVRGTERTREDSVSTGRQLHPPSFLVHTVGIITELIAWGYLLWRLNDLLHVSHILRASLVAQMVKNLPAMQETWVWSLSREDTLEKGMATHSSIHAWRIPWTEKPGGLQSMGLQRVRHNQATNTFT